MRILHTSDWHLGQQFIGKSREAEHRAFFKWLISQIIELQVDVLLVAGDIFDTATPPSYAKALYHQLIVDLQPTRCHVVLLGGNHDSVAVLNESANLLGCLNTDVVPGYWQEQAKHLLPLKNKAGEQKLWLLALPFLRARDLSVLTTAQSSAGQTALEKQQQLQQQIAQVYQQLFALARETNAQFPIVATGHLTTVGASRSESEREIYIGNLDAFPAQAFPPVDYLALGHIHQGQKVAGSDYLRYCGSPIALSF
ncbi:MAG: exonuclease subunit SbcD [Rheinheimera sp.]|nr:exonuclease subunit SbcD [Rheinheimera sp.]